MYHTTGFSKDEITALCAMIAAQFPGLAGHSTHAGRPPVLGLFKSVVVTLSYLRRNRVQCELGEYVGASQSTISRRVATFTPGPLKDATWIADTGYVGMTAITPRKKPRGARRSEADKIVNKSVSSIRAAIEHAIRHLKEWKVLATGYRGRLRELPAVIRTVARLELFRLGW